MREADWIAVWVTVHVFAERTVVNVSRDRRTLWQSQLYNQPPSGAPGCCSLGQAMAKGRPEG